MDYSRYFNDEEDRREVYLAYRDKMFKTGIPFSAYSLCMTGMDKHYVAQPGFGIVAFYIDRRRFLIEGQGPFRTFEEAKDFLLINDLDGMIGELPLEVIRERDITISIFHPAD
jgi:hypothetical protein